MTVADKLIEDVLAGSSPFDLIDLLVETAKEFGLKPGEQTWKMDQLKKKTVKRFHHLAGRCKATLAHADPARGTWRFRVKGGEDYSSPKGWVVTLSSKRVGNLRKVDKLPVYARCTCPAWVWWGPDHNAYVRGFLNGRPRSNLKPPTVRDPRRRRWVCKHVIAASKMWEKYFLTDKPERGAKRRRRR